MKLVIDDGSSIDSTFNGITHPHKIENFCLDHICFGFICFYLLYSANILVLLFIAQEARLIYTT